MVQEDILEIEREAPGQEKKTKRPKKEYPGETVAYPG
jgi:hypothetical protein